MSDKSQFSNNKNNQVEVKQDAQGTEKPRKRQRMRLSSAKEVKRYITSIMLRIENDEIEESKARLLNNLAETILKSMRLDEMEKRIVEIESLLNGDHQATADNDVEEFLKRAK